MPYLIAYDIEHDRYRTKIADKLLEIGFVRLQKSVFIGSVKDRLYAQAIQWLQKDIKPHLAAGDKLLTLTLTQSQLDDFWFLLDKPDGWDDLLDPPHTLIL